MRTDRHIHTHTHTHTYDEANSRIFNLTFIIPCIVIYSYSTANNMHLLSQIIHSCKTLYMFRTVFPSIIRSSKLRIQQQAYVKQTAAESSR
jgi:hypothetical protein